MNPPAPKTGKSRNTPPRRSAGVPGTHPGMRPGRDDVPDMGGAPGRGLGVGKAAFGEGKPPMRSVPCRGKSPVVPSAGGKRLPGLDASVMEEASAWQSSAGYGGPAGQGIPAGRGGAAGRRASVRRNVPAAFPLFRPLPAALRKPRIRAEKGPCGTCSIKAGRAALQGRAHG